jgi:hypothetical protein
METGVEVEVGSTKVVVADMMAETSCYLLDARPVAMIKSR